MVPKVDGTAEYDILEIQRLPQRFNMIASSNIVSSTFSPLPQKPNSSPTKSSLSPPKSLKIAPSFEWDCNRQLLLNNLKILRPQTRRTSLNAQSPQDPPLVSSEEEEENELLGKGEGEGERDWTTSFLLFSFWSALMYYVFFLAPNQTPVSLIAFYGFALYGA